MFLCKLSHIPVNREVEDKNVFLGFKKETKNPQRFDFVLKEQSYQEGGFRFGTFFF